MIETLVRLMAMVREEGWGGVLVWAVVTVAVGLLIQLAFVAVGALLRRLYGDRTHG